MRALALENAASVDFLWFVLFEGKDGRQTEVMIQFSARQRPAKSHRREHITVKKKGTVNILISKVNAGKRMGG